MQFSPRNLKCYVCIHVFNTSRGVEYIAHDEGDWIFACGQTDHSHDDWRVVGVAHLTDRDTSLHQCAELPNGWQATRDKKESKWVFEVCDPLD